MPPKTRTRAALQPKQEEGETEPTAAARDTTSPEVPQDGEDETTKSPVKRVRIRTATTTQAKAVSGRAKLSREEAAKAEEQGKGKKARGKGKMASTGTSRKRRQEAATNAADVRGGEDGENVEVKVESQPPSKRRRNDKTNGPVEETDRVVFAAQPTAATRKQRQKRLPKNKEMSPMEMGDVPPISHHSHSTLSGQVFVMGQGDMGQLGLGEDMLERKKPHPVGGDLEGCVITQVTCGGMHTVALTKDGKVFTWGCNDEGALGRSVEDGEEFSPGVVDKLGGVKVVQVAAGDSHTAALTDSGSIYCWGVFRDSNGAFGLVQTTPSLSPELLYSNPYSRAVKVASGSDHVVFLTEHGDICTFGCAEQGQLGRVSECFSSRGGRKGISLLLSPNIVRCRVKKGGGKPKFADIFCGPYHTFAVAEDGLVYVWGLNNYGQLCTGDLKTRYQPERLTDDWIGGWSMGGAKCSVAMASGQHHTVVCCDGDVFTCGRREYGRLGLGQNSDEPSRPTRIDSLKEVKVASVEASGSCSFAVTETGNLYSWGMGTNLQLGMADEDDVWTPVKVTGKKIENRRILSVSSGGQHTVVLVSAEI